MASNGDGRPYRSLSAIARAITGTRWNGWTFFGLRNQRSGGVSRTAKIPVTMPAAVRKLRCASTPESHRGRDSRRNSIRSTPSGTPVRPTLSSQRAEGWVLVPDRYDDGGFSGATLERPALRRLLADIEAGRVDIIVIYKLDRLSRSLMDFVKLIELFDQHDVTFVCVTQSFNTTTSMGRLTLNILLSFAQFEREVIGERIRDKFAASQGARNVDGRKGAARIFDVVIGSS